MDFLKAYVLIVVTALMADSSWAEEETCAGSLVVGYLPVKTSMGESSRLTSPLQLMPLVNKKWDSSTPSPPKTWKVYREKDLYADELHRKEWTSPGSGTCYNTSFVLIHLSKEEWDYGEIYNIKVLAELDGVDVVVGHHIPAVERYCKEKKIAYVLSLPPTIELENRMLAENESERVMFSAWPSWDDFFKMSSSTIVVARPELNVARDSRFGRVFIFVEGLDSELLAVANKLADVLMSEKKADTVKLRNFALSDINPNNMRANLLDIIHEFEPNVFIYMYGKEDQLKSMINTIFRVRNRFTHMFRKEARRMFLFWDMTMAFNGVLSNFLTFEGEKVAKMVHLQTMSLMTTQGPFGLPCDNVTMDLTELVGAHDATLMALYNVATIPDGNFSKASLLNLFRERTNKLANVIVPDLYGYRRKIVHCGLSFENGFRVFTSVWLGTVWPNMTIPAGLYPSSQTRAYLEENDEGQDFSDCRPKLDFIELTFWDERRNKTAYGGEFGKELKLEDRTKDTMIVAVLEDPVAFRVGTQKDYSGIAPDIINEAFFRMSKRLGWVDSYKIYHTPDNEYGMYNHSTKKWTGALGELKKGKAVMAIGMFSKTSSRQSEFDFGPAFEYVGLTFMLKYSVKSPGYFTFMRPFKLNVWWGLLLVMLISSVFIHLLDRWNPFMDTVEPDKRFQMNESMWYSFGTITQAGGEFVPVMYPTRIYSCFYWFFALVVTACYTGNLATFLVEQEKYMHVDRISKLPFRKNMQWGTLKGSSMEEYLRHIDTKHDLTDLSRGLSYVENYNRGTNRAMKGDFAFIGTSLLLQYYAATDPDCDLAVSPHEEAISEIAFPIRKDWPLKHEFEKAMGDMWDDFTTRDILQRWISKTKCSEADDDDSDHIQLPLGSFIGIYIVLGVFTAMAFILLFIKLGLLKLKERQQKLQMEADKSNTSENGEDVNGPMIEEKADVQNGEEDTVV